MLKGLLKQYRIIILLITMMSMSCAATLLKSPNSSFNLDDNNSIIFGKAEVVFDGQSIDYKGTSYLVKKTIMHHISRYVSDEEINNNKWKAGEYAFSVTSDKDGYFAFAVPPGKYYFVEFDYIGVLPDVDYFGVRTYMSIKGEVKKPYLMSFDVPPNRAVYIGTIRHEFHTIEKSWVHFKAGYVIDVVENYEVAKKWFLESNRNLVEYLIDGVAEKTPIHITDNK